MGLDLASLHPVELIVWIPVYKKDLSLPELLSLFQATIILSGSGSVLAGKEHRSRFLKRLSNGLVNASVSTYPDSVFSSVLRYCNLLLSPRFYAEFGSSHLLVTQLDAWICSSDLRPFLRYDYVTPTFYPHPLESSLLIRRDA